MGWREEFDRQNALRLNQAQHQFRDHVSRLEAKRRESDEEREAQENNGYGLGTVLLAGLLGFLFSKR
jgi:hypothetical protein